MAKKKLTDLTGDGKVTQADVLKGRGVFNAGGDIQSDHKLIMEALYQDRLKNNQSFKDFEKSIAGKLYRKLTKLGSVVTGTKPKSLNAMSGEYLTSEEAEEYSKALKKLQSNDKQKPRTTRQQKAEGGDINSQMEMMLGEESMPMEEEMPIEEPMVSDETMESDYLDFILDEALDEEEEDFLMEQLESNDKLSLIFDKVIDVATEFAGSGPVNGPGSGVSDSIPARLSDGEFVFTAKATEEIGADNLEAVMKEAEASADERQQVAEGGEIEEESVEMPVQAAQQQNIRVSRPTVSALAARQEQKDIVGDEIKKRMMLDPNQKHVRS